MTEMSNLTNHINELLTEQDLPTQTTILKPENLIDTMRDGLLLSKLLERVSPGITKSSGQQKPCKNQEACQKFRMLENQAMVLKAAERLGCTLVNVGPSDLVEGREQLMLGIVWQILKVASQATPKHNKEGEDGVSENLDSAHEFMKIA